MPGCVADSALRRLAAAGFLFVAATALAVDLAPPQTRIEPTIETFHGITVEDPYRWLESIGSEETIAWFRAQNEYARGVLDALPGRAALRARLDALHSTQTRISDLQWASDRVFYLKRAPSEASFALYVRDSIAAPERKLVAPEDYAVNGVPGDIDYFRASPNGRRIAFGISHGGDEVATLYVIDVATGSRIGTPIPRARFAAPAWRFDSAILFYTQQQQAASDAPTFERIRRSHAYVRIFDEDGTTRDTAVLGAGLNADVALDPDDIPWLATSPVSPFVIGVVQRGVQRELTLYAARLTELRGAATPWRKLAGPERGIVDFDLRGEWIYVRTHENAPRGRIVRWSLNRPGPLRQEAAEVVVPESERVIEGFSVAKEALYVHQREATFARLLRLPFNSLDRRSAVSTKGRAGKRPSLRLGDVVKLPFEGAIEEWTTDPLHAGALIKLSGWTEAPGYYLVDGRSGLASRTTLLPPGGSEFAGVVATQARVRSHDGVEVPVSIVMAKNLVRDGRARVWLDAYGAYAISEDARYLPLLLAWIEQGGVYVVAHVRGGGELGEDWHRAGQKSSKPNTWRDVIAVAEWLVRERYTIPERLAVSGSSAGGIAAGNAIVDRPDLFAAMISIAGFHDTLRSETSMTGPANVPEFGSVADPEGFRALLAMSSYARMRDGVAYPAALFSTGFNDPRVDAWDPGKTAARLQAVNAGPGGSGKPVLLRVDFARGHVGGTAAQLIDEYTDVLAFLLWQTGAPDFAPP